MGINIKAFVSVYHTEETSFISDKSFFSQCSLVYGLIKVKMFSSTKSKGILVSEIILKGIIKAATGGVL